MNIVSEQYIQINLWCKPLSRSRYSFDEVRKKKLHLRSDGTTTLLATMRERDRKEAEASRILQREQREKDNVHAEYTNALSEFSEVFAGFSKSEIAEAIETESEAAEEPVEAVSRPRLKRFRSKIDAAVFDYSEIEQQKIEEEINDLVNADGYYDEVKPVDADEEYEEKNPINKTVILLIGALIVFLAGFAVYFRFFF